jgi:hypothetical protein
VLNILCYLGILDKVSFAQVPVGLYQTTIKGASVSFFRLNHVTTAEQIESRLMALKAAKINRKNFSCKRLEEAFGESEARRVYPDYYDIEETKRSKSKSEFLTLVPTQSNEEIEEMIDSLPDDIEATQEPPNQLRI